MSSSVDSKHQKLIKICPGCAMAHMAKCREEAESREEEEDRSHPQSRLNCALTSSKRLCKVTGELTLAHCLILLYHIIVTITGAIFRLVTALIPIAEYYVLILIYSLECCFWVWHENKIHHKVLKGLASVVAILFLSYIAYVLLVSFVLPTLALVYTLFYKGHSLV